MYVFLMMCLTPQCQRILAPRLRMSLLYELSQHTCSTLNIPYEHMKAKEDKARGNLNSGPSLP